jgi:hypothetical protein
MSVCFIVDIDIYIFHVKYIFLENSAIYEVIKKNTAVDNRT